MNDVKRRMNRALTVLLIAISLIISGSAIEPIQVQADGSSGPNLGAIWVIPEMISGARQPASGGMFAWVTFDYINPYYDATLAETLSRNTSDFVLQMKTQGGDWTDQPGSNIVIMGGEEVYTESFEAIIAAAVPENTDPYIKKWRVVYKPDSDTERLESEIIVQAAALEESDDVTAFNKEYCADFRVEKVPWSYEEYEIDHIPPVYVAYVYPDVITTFKDPGLVKPDGTKHKIVLPNVGNWDYDEGQGFGQQDLQNVGTDLRYGDTEEDNGGIAGLVDYWVHNRDAGKEGSDDEEYYFPDEWPGSEFIPDATDLYNKLASVVCVPDENADEYLTYIIDGTNVFWISGASTQEAVENGVTDHILVIVRDWESYGESRHDWSNAPVWEWKGNSESGFTSATATFTCANHSGHVRKVRAVIRSTEVDEKTVYTASAVFNGDVFTDTKTAITPDNEEDYKVPAPAPTPAPEKAAAVTKKKAKTPSVNTGTVNAKAVKKAVKSAGGKATTLVIGSKVKKISKGAFKGSGIKTIVIKSKKLKKKTVKNALKGSKVKTIQVKVGSKKLNKKYIKIYKKIFTKKNAGRKVKIK